MEIKFAIILFLFYHENAFENVVYKMAAILTRERWVNLFAIIIYLW